MKSILSFTAALFLTGSSALAQPTITIGCFHFGPETCDATSNPPSINLNGFHMGEVNPAETGPTPPKFYKVKSADCGNGIGPNLTVGSVVEFGAGPAGIVINETAYLVGQNVDGSASDAGGYISASEFGGVSYDQVGNAIAAVDVKFSFEKIIITSANPNVGVCELDAQ